MQEFTEELKDIKTKLVKVTAKKLELSTKLYAIEARSNKRLAELTIVQGAQDSVEVLVQSIGGLSVKALDAFIEQVGTQLEEHVRALLEGVYTGRKLL